MSRRTRFVLGALVVGSAWSWAWAQPAAKRPMGPRTGPYSVQMFAGSTQFCWIAVWPPTNYEDGTPIPVGTKVQVKVYRSYDGGKKYGTRGVSIVGGGQGFVGQGEKDARKKRWIDCKLKTPVNNKRPFAVWLAASVIVQGAESKLTNRYLNFRYVGKDGRPRLIRYETPDVSGAGLDDELARPLPQELPGVWSGGEFVLTHIAAREAGLKPKEREACRKTVAGLEKQRNKPTPMTINIKEIDLVGAPGLGGNPVDPGQARKVHFPGKLTMTIIDPKSKKPPKESDPMGFMYNYRDRSIRIENRDKSGSIRFGGHFFKNATHYSVHGTWKLSSLQEGREVLSLGGTWSGKKRKR